MAELWDLYDENRTFLPEPELVAIINYVIVIMQDDHINDSVK